jgi:hypothetical protein
MIYVINLHFLHLHTTILKLTELLTKLIDP